MKTVEQAAPPASDEWGTRASRGRKNTRKWCKGKVGREHQPVVTLDKNMLSLRGRLGKPLCRLPEEGEKHPLWLYCSHQVTCEVCEKVLEWTPAVCPTTSLALR